MLIAGIDENGLGPRLGPLVVTAAAFEASAYDRELFWSLAGEDLPAGDSKLLWKRTNPALGERIALGWLEVMGADSATHARLVDSVFAPPPVPAPCPDSAGRRGAGIACEAGEDILPRWGGRRPEISEARRRFDAAGIRPRAARSALLCPGALNAAVESVGKLELDFRAMLGALAAVGRAGGEEVLALCGKVGSTRRYGRWLDALGHRWSALREEPEISVYRVESIGELRFIRDGDADHLPIAAASMIGKYLRELAMRRLSEALGAAGPGAPSGYRDPVTARFIEQSVAIRALEGIPERCFVRRK
ncbi:MAG: hypothetical protein R6V85_15855 [Polyangia bacterium]